MPKVTLHIRDFRTRFPEVNTTKFAEVVGLNSTLFRKYTCESTPVLQISQERIDFIESKMHELGQLLLDTELVK